MRWLRVSCLLSLVPVTAQAQSWVNVTPTSVNPSPRQAIAAREVDGSTLIFGGESGSGYGNETWRWLGSSWTQLFPANSPPVRRASCMVAEPSCQGIVLFGGENGSKALGDTWAWDGTDWTDVTPSIGPSPRSGSGCAYDPTRDVVVLFGGVKWGGSQQYNDTWEWDCGSRTWTERNPAATVPQPRDGAAMAYAGSGHVVLYGGLDRIPSLVYLNDTWVWDGMSWTEVTPGQGPSRTFGLMSYDEHQKNVVMFGGAWYSGGWHYTDETWQGTLYMNGGTPGWTWTEIVTDPRPPARSASFGLSYDPVRRATLLFGGGHSSGDFNDTWLFFNSGNAIPAVSTWGLLVMGLLAMVTGTCVFIRQAKHKQQRTIQV